MTGVRTRAASCTEHEKSKIAVNIYLYSVKVVEVSVVDYYSHYAVLMTLVLYGVSHIHLILDGVSLKSVPPFRLVPRRLNN